MLNNFLLMNVYKLGTSRFRRVVKPLFPVDWVVVSKFAGVGFTQPTHRLYPALCTGTRFGFTPVVGSFYTQSPGIVTKTNFI